MSAMARVFGMHEVELRPGVDPEDFEQFVAKEMSEVHQFPGWRSYLLKGDRGVRAGKYLWVFEVESVATRDRFAPTPDTDSAEAEEFQRQHPETIAVFEKWAAITLPGTGPGHIFTDYVVLSPHEDLDKQDH
jgi:hypothetical protein